MALCRHDLAGRPCQLALKASGGSPPSVPGHVEPCTAPRACQTRTQGLLTSTCPCSHMCPCLVAGMLLGTGRCSCWTACMCRKDLCSTDGTHMQAYNERWGQQLEAPVSMDAYAAQAAGFKVIMLPLPCGIALACCVVSSRLGSRSACCLSWHASFHASCCLVVNQPQPVSKGRLTSHECTKRP